MFSETTKMILKTAGVQAVGTVLGGAVFQVGVRLGNAAVDSARDVFRAVTGAGDRQ